MAIFDYKNKFSLNNLFLLCTLFIIPIIVAHFSFTNIINENYYADLQKIKDKLELQSIKIEKISQPKYQINDFIKNLIKNNKLMDYTPEQIKNFIERLDAKYPEAFRWRFGNGNGEAIRINSKAVLPGEKTWNVITRNLITNINALSNPNDVFANFKKDKELDEALPNMQVMMGGNNKLEHLTEALDNAIDFDWQGKKCYAVWSADAIEYKDGFPTKTKGGALLLVFPDKLSPTIWMTRMIKQRKTGTEKLEYPVIILNISDNYSEYADKDLPQSTEFSMSLIDAYKNRSTKFFIHKEYLGICSGADINTDYRLISLADISLLLKVKNKHTLTLYIVTSVLLIITVFLCIFANKNKKVSISLRKRIAAIFIIAIIMPVVSLISIGSAFTRHEETRLKDSAYTRMRQGIEALNLRYKDTPRVVEKEIYGILQEMLGKPPYNKDTIIKVMNKAIEERLISNFFLTDKKGKITDSSWNDIDKVMRRMIELTCEKSLPTENRVDDRANGVQMYVDEELEEFFKTIKYNMDFSRPTHLRYFAYIDRHLYMMSIHVKIENDVCALVLQLPERHLERLFAQNEFKANRLTKTSLDLHGENILELSFFSSLYGEQSFPEESPVWTSLKADLTRAASLASEEKGEIVIDNETFMYLIKPLASMKEKSLIPCYLTSARHIQQRTTDITILFVSLSLAAILGTFLLSLSLTSSLLEPIKTIDVAAQLVGEGDLNVIVPETGEDELGHLSKTFNKMLKGLREHQKMQAYVSDSVKEAIQEGDKETEELRNGKNIEATILFADIRNFTSITEKNEPGDVFELLNEFLGGVEPIIRMNHGRVDKYIGDAVMAVFHKSVPEHHALSAVKTAVMMMKFVEKLNFERKEAGLFPIAIGVGISTGTVLLGDVGSADRKDLTVIGDEVNLASRLESASKQGKHSKIIFSGSTYQFIQDKVEVELMPFNEIRGKEQAVSIYELVKFNG